LPQATTKSNPFGYLPRLTLEPGSAASTKASLESDNLTGQTHKLDAPSNQNFSPQQTLLAATASSSSEPTIRPQSDKTSWERYQEEISLFGTGGIIVQEGLYCSKWMDDAELHPALVAKTKTAFPVTSNNVEK